MCSNYFDVHMLYPPDEVPETKDEPDIDHEFGPLLFVPKYFCTASKTRKL